MQGEGGKDIMMSEEQVISQDEQEKVEKVISGFRGQRWSLIPTLQKVQGELGYIPPQAIPVIAQALGIFPSQVQGVTSFYVQFRSTRPAEHAIKVCLGTACHVRGGARILAEVEKRIGIKVGETTEDYKFSLERVACFGCCALSPIMVVDGVVHSKMTPVKAREVLSSYQ
jgi:NADH:ubiquinone oxidoreductase subunit E